MGRGIAAGNWKMHGSRAFISQYVRSMEGQIGGIGHPVVLFPPAGYLSYLTEALAAAGLSARVQVGAQNLHPEVQGAFTGEMSGEMLKDLGAGWVLAGHSERRQLAGETNELVAEKVAAAARAGLKPVLCVGETDAEREAGRAEAVVLGQLDCVLDRCGPEVLAAGAIAYEPVWAIGTGKTATPELAEEMHRLIRGALARRSKPLAEKQPILYGGSVKSGNAKALFACQNIDGGLVGGASLEAGEFMEIARALDE